jgi:hypothetical protein
MLLAIGTQATLQVGGSSAVQAAPQSACQVVTDRQVAGTDGVGQDARIVAEVEQRPAVDGAAARAR